MHILEIKRGERREDRGERERDGDGERKGERESKVVKVYFV